MKRCRRKNKYLHQDRMAMLIADSYDMVEDYKVARRKGYTPLEALEDWDLLQPEDRHLLEKQ